MHLQRLQPIVMCGTELLDDGIVIWLLDYSCTISWTPVFLTELVRISTSIPV